MDTKMSNTTIPLVDLVAQYQAIKMQLDAAIASIVESVLL